ncbi:MAG: type II toxin-antitoxin system VapC family toxin [Firmicutes bacterium]|nr:type II toxin-antitoxin system VapC family toxin [Bacillota bacterium]NBI62966.1 type II toxin-antitoxin system VapC family toxin [Clostridiales bacterium]
MMYMLDTNICIYAIKNKPEQVLRRIKSNMRNGLCVSVITLAELEHGVQKSLYPEKNAMALIQFLAVLEVLPFDDLAAVEYGKLCAYLQKRGTPIGTMDMLIAAHAKVENAVLVTNNVREFKRVPGLTIENWAE